MALIKVDVIGLEPLERRIHLFVNLRARQAAIRFGHGEIELGREHVSVARHVRERFPQERLRRPSPVDVRGIDEVDAERERLLHAGSRRLTRRRRRNR